MEFKTRSKASVFADLAEKLRGLPAAHSDCAVLTRMIHDLSRELGVEPDRSVQTDRNERKFGVAWCGTATLRTSSSGMGSKQPVRRDDYSLVGNRQAVPQHENGNCKGSDQHGCD
jgi:hypothetical protein